MAIDPGALRGPRRPGDLLDCSFCGMAQKQVSKLIAGTHARICDQCVATADQVITTGETAATALSAVKSIGADLPAIKCDFCGKTRQQVSGIAAAARGTICSECLLLCHEIVAEELA
jgi:ATP-dependent protease Clp ATPase subunit